MFTNVVGVLVILVGAFLLLRGSGSGRNTGVFGRGPAIGLILVGVILIFVMAESDILAD